jgi:hypothetical protein
MFLTSVRKTKENAMDILLLAQACEADEARQQCYDVLQQMTLTELDSQSAFTDLDGPSTRTLLLPIVKRFHECLKSVNLVITQPKLASQGPRPSGSTV